ncbi:uncharacterized protein BP5553_03968 [Venustampulla echinocandica]|uniref:Alpha/beta hydrolase fold-3 domain-containing protein n=1 Tax=Venustampulla echinocandica TaxID=2656787 RepID=A0A370TVY0_9HELO|nr:uncharacterized protein BP5553_03968 [Venustampulla echinocandica]RDL39628.1 hypothetical protein BP5553_03968 [Venustampulla echinocandica]
MADQPSSAPINLRPSPFLTRLRFAVRIRVLKFLLKTVFQALNLPGIRDKSVQPTFTKVYPCQPGLTNRVYIPKSYKSGDALLPLYLNFHGGGFALMSPVGDDKFCSEFAHENKVLVVSLDYPKSPGHKFPAASEAALDLVNAVLEDEALPIDKSKVAIGGFSAGGNLALSVSQYESLQGKIGGIVAYYPPVDMTTPIEVSLATRPKDAPPDVLRHDAAMFNWGYIKPEQDLRDPLLSPTFAPREKLPPKLYFIGCEHDLLCRGAEIMAEKLADVGGPVRTGSDDCWERNGIKWEKIIAEEHAFDVVPSFGATKIRRAKRRVEMHKSVAEWLFREVYH